ncbi:cysteine dioxygenase family protein [Paenibacillus sp. CC-CFT747]|nr:cysteine dioxygenase family protein [Paenibacillus sp. CC-CFT747]
MDLIQQAENKLAGLCHPTLEELRQALSSLDLTPEQTSPYVTEPDRFPYGRRVIFRSKDVEAVVLHFPPYVKTAIHNHGEAIGCACVLQGTILNTVYKVGAYGFAEPQENQEVTEGQWLFAPYSQIHALSNPSDRPAVSVHLYSPPLEGIKGFQPIPELDYVI